MTEAARRPLALHAKDIAPRLGSLYPEPFATQVAGRAKRALGDPFGLAAFGVNLTRLPPGARSAMRHAHTREDEFVFVLEGTPTLVTNSGALLLHPGMCAGFAAGSGDAHQLVNHGATEAVYLEVGSRAEGDEVHYPDDDLAARKVDGRWGFFHKDGRPY